MTPEQKLDRLERIARLMVKAGLKARKYSREQDEKINMIINAQIKNEEMFAQNEVRFAKNEERFARNEERFAKRFGELAEAQIELAAAQVETNHRLDVLIDVIKEGRNGTSG